MKKLAKALLMAAQIREESYDHATADKASEQARKNYAQSNRTLDLCVDYVQFYGKTMGQSCAQACKECGLDEDDSIMVNSILYTMWNDAIDWAKSKLDADEIPAMFQ